MSVNLILATAPPGRRCGECTLCCKLLPVGDLDKGAGQRCRYQSVKGCKVYGELERVSPDCRAWSCRWLVDPEAHDLRRPDRSHYVLDIMPDVVVLDAGGEKMQLPVIQIWVDPQHPDAHRDPALRAYLNRLYETDGMIALVRYNSGDGFAIFPPASNTDGEWREVGGVTDKTMPSVAERVAMFAAGLTP